MALFGRETTRDISVQARGLINAHIDECKETRADTKRDIQGLRDDLDTKHAENKAQFVAWARMMQKVQWGVISILASVLAKIIFDTVHFQIHIGP